VDGCEEYDLAARRLPQLGNTVPGGTRLPEHPLAAHGNLVRPDDDRARPTRSDGLRFPPGKPDGEIKRPLRSERRFVGVRRDAFELETQSPEQFAPILRGRGQDEPKPTRCQAGSTALWSLKNRV
jgi:hypothetical protein